MLPLVVAALAAQRPEPMQVTALALEAGHSFESALSADLDGDGSPDLLLARRDDAGLRSLRAFPRRAGRIAPQALWTVTVPADVTAYAVGELDPRPGRELLLLSGNAAVLCFPLLEGRERFQLLAEVEFLWQARPETGLLAWPHAVVDLDADGDDDLLLPEPGGARFLRQERDDERATFTLELLRVGQSEALQDFTELERVVERIRPLATRSGPGTLLSILDSTPVPFVLDVDGDGRLDIAMQDGSRRLSWLARADGFELEERQLPFEVDVERELDVSWASHLADIDGRPGAESVLVARARKDGSDRTQVLVYGADYERPLQVIVLQGLVTTSELIDLDGDGALDLATASIGDDFLEGLRSSAGGEGIEFTVNVFPNRGGRFERRPALIEKVRFEGEAEPVSLLCADATGDGALEALLRTDDATLRMVTILTRGERWRMVQDKPIWSRGLGPEASFLPIPGDDQRRRFLAHEPGQVFLFEVER